MEILSFYEHRRRKVWFSSLRALLALIMVTSFRSFQGTPSTTAAMDVEVTSSDHLTNLDTKSFPYTEGYPPSSKSPEDPEEESFWDGVEEVDLTIPIEDLTLDEDFEDSFYLFFNESMFLDIDCETFSMMTPPPTWTKVPSPPLPPFLGTVSYDLRNYNIESGTNGLGVSSVYSEEGEEEEEEECNLCKWVSGGNQTLDFFAKKQSEETTSTTRSMIGIMVGVAIVSATIGAAIMSFLLKCKRNTGESSCLRNSCPVVIQRRRSPKLSSDSSKQNDNHESTETTQVETAKSDTSPGAGWHLKMWKRNTSLSPVNACSSPVSESSYIEDQYVNCDANSAVYAELNGEEGLTLSGPKITQITSMASNTYSEIGNGDLSSDTKTSSQGESICNNENLITTDPDRNDSSAGSASTPSSAYYSDVSSYDICSSSKGKLKGSKTDNIVSDANKQYTIRAISNGIEFHPVRQDMRAVNLDNLPLNSTTVSSPSLQLLPKQLNTDHNYMLNSNPRYHQNINHPLNLPSNYILHSMDKYDEGCAHHPRLSPQTQNTYSHYEGIYEDNMMPVRHYPGIISNQRPLPALPSRRISGPKKKRFNTHLENGAAPLESNYV